MSRTDVSAFDALAATYDQQFTDSPVGSLQRDRVHHYLEKHLYRLDHPLILDLGCGTGADAMWFAKKKARVCAVDQSEEMIRVGREKLAHAGLESLVTFVHKSMSDLDGSLGSQKFDLIFSNFGAFNCLSPVELKSLAHTSVQYLSKHGQLIAVVMGSFCLWETLYFLTRLDYKNAFRRLSRNSVKAHLGQGAYTDTWYYSPGQFYHLFSEHFKLKVFYPIGFFLPPTYFSGSRFLSAFLLKQLARMERMTGNLQSASYASDHYLIHLSRKH